MAVNWEMPDGSEVRYEGTAVDTRALRLFILRFIGNDANLWDTTKWDAAAVAEAFERRFGEKVSVETVPKSRGRVAHVIRPLPV